MMTISKLFSDGRNQPRSNYPPRSLGSSASRLLTLLDGTHHGVTATPRQKKLVRLWIDSGAAYPGTYAALGTGMIGNYTENGHVNTDAGWPTTRAVQPVFETKCAGCHLRQGPSLPRTLSDETGVSFWLPQLGDRRLNTSRHIVFNLSRPEKSLFLLAPLARAAGGWEQCRDPKTGKPAPVFATTSDPGYQKLLAMCVAGKDYLERVTRFDMPGFHPRADWVRELKRFGILESNLSPGSAIDVYATERKYWQSLWYAPPRS